MLASLLVILVGVVAGFGTYLVGTPIINVIDNTLIGQLLTVSVPLVIGIVGNWIVLRSAKLPLRSPVALSVQSLGLLAGPLYFSIIGNDYQMLAALATMVLCTPAMFVIPLFTKRILWRR